MPITAVEHAARRRRRMLTPLQTLREQRTLSQREMALLVGCSQQTYARYETGASVPPPDRRAKIAALLGTTADVLWPPGERQLRAVAAR